MSRAAFARMWLRCRTCSTTSQMGTPTRNATLRISVSITLPSSPESWAGGVPCKETRKIGWLRTNAAPTFEAKRPRPPPSRPTAPGLRARRIRAIIAAPTGVGGPGRPRHGRGAEDPPHATRARRPCLQGRLRRSRARLPDRRLVRGVPRRALDRGVLHEPDEGHEGDAELLRAVRARYHDRLQRPREGGGGDRLPREVLRLRGALDRPSRAPGRQGRARQAPERARRGARGAVDDRDADAKPRAHVPGHDRRPPLRS